MGMSNWQPTASLHTLQKRAQLFAAIRCYFSEHNVMEVAVPVLGECGVSDLHIDSIEANSGGKIQYLQTSPEYFMKRLLAFGSGDIYSLAKAFRDGEAGRRHHPEFTLLEWYRLGWDEQQLIDETVVLIQLAMGDVAVHKLSYRDAFQSVLHCDPHTVELSQLQKMAIKFSGMPTCNEDRSICLDLLFSLQVEPKLPAGIVAVFDYPACQAALAQLAQDQRGETIARRFEVFVNGMELANGYFELCNVEEQGQRFAADQAARKAANKKTMAADQNLLSALQQGLPSCAGVALGIDRLLMQVLGLSKIGEVMSFSDG